MDLDAEDTVLSYQLPPRDVCESRVRQDVETSFEELRTTLRARGAHSESVLIGWAGANVPELPNVLRREAKPSALTVQSLQRLPRDGAERVVVLEGAKQNVGVNENGDSLRDYHRSGYQFSRVNACSPRTGC